MNNNSNQHHEITGIVRVRNGRMYFDLPIDAAVLGALNQKRPSHMFIDEVAKLLRVSESTLRSMDKDPQCALKSFALRGDHGKRRWYRDEVELYARTGDVPKAAMHSRPKSSERPPRIIPPRPPEPTVKRRGRPPKSLIRRKPQGKQVEALVVQAAVGS